MSSETGIFNLAMNFRDNASRGLNRSSSALTAFEAKLDYVAKVSQSKFARLERAQKSFQGMAMKGAITAFAGGAILSKLTDKAAEYGSKITELGFILEQSGEKSSLDMMKANIVKVGKATSFSMTEIAIATTDLKRIGISVQASMDMTGIAATFSEMSSKILGVTESAMLMNAIMAKAGLTIQDTTGMDKQTKAMTNQMLVSDMLAKAASTTALAYEDFKPLFRSAGSALSDLNMVGKEGIATFLAMASTAKRLQQGPAEIGQSIVGLSRKISQFGKKGAFENLVGRLRKGGKRARRGSQSYQALQGLFPTKEEFDNLFKTTEGRLRKIPDIFDDLNKKLSAKNMGELDRIAAIDLIFGTTMTAKTFKFFLQSTETITKATAKGNAGYAEYLKTHEKAREILERDGRVVLKGKEAIDARTKSILLSMGTGALYIKNLQQDLKQNKAIAAGSFDLLQVMLGESIKEEYVSMLKSVTILLNKMVDFGEENPQLAKFGVLALAGVTALGSLAFVLGTVGMAVTFGIKKFGMLGLLLKKNTASGNAETLSVGRTTQAINTQTVALQRNNAVRNVRGFGVLIQDTTGMAVAGAPAIGGTGLPAGIQMRDTVAVAATGAAVASKKLSFGAKALSKATGLFSKVGGGLSKIAGTMGGKLGLALIAYQAYSAVSSIATENIAKDVVILEKNKKLIEGRKGISEYDSLKVEETAFSKEKMQSAGGVLGSIASKVMTAGMVSGFNPIIMALTGVTTGMYEMLDEFSKERRASMLQEKRANLKKAYIAQLGGKKDYQAQVKLMNLGRDLTLEETKVLAENQKKQRESLDRRIRTRGDEALKTGKSLSFEQMVGYDLIPLYAEQRAKDRSAFTSLQKKGMFKPLAGFGGPLQPEVQPKFDPSKYDTRKKAVDKGMTTPLVISVTGGREIDPMTLRYKDLPPVDNSAYEEYKDRVASVNVLSPEGTIAQVDLNSSMGSLDSTMTKFNENILLMQSFNAGKTTVGGKQKKLGFGNAENMGDNDKHIALNLNMENANMLNQAGIDSIVNPLKAEWKKGFSNMKIKIDNKGYGEINVNDFDPYGRRSSFAQ